MLPVAAQLRIIDANLNRLAEGLRVIEDVCRFALDDAALARRLKQMRARTQQLRAAFPPGLTAARDAARDVGRAAIPEPERRDDLAQVLGAAFGRVQQAARSLEEMGKLLSPEPARLAKALRYEAYELQRLIEPLFDRRLAAARLHGLYLILTDPRAGYEAAARAAVKAGVTAVQLRAKNLAGGPLLDLARRLREITRNTQTLFFVNDRPDIACLCDADGLHLGQHDLPVAEARAIVGDRMLVGKSTHNLRELHAALREQPDYLAVGPVFATASKADPDPMLGLHKAARMLERARRRFHGPVVAIGGIDQTNLTSVLETGFDAYALIGAVGRQARPAGIIRRLKRLEPPAKKS